MQVGLRIDVDTYRGTRYGVQRLLKILAARNLRASFFFSVGPDNMGRHLWRLLRPGFFAKMLRSRAPSLYGWDILLRGTLWPGPLIGEKLGNVIRAAADGGHEVGLHAWDHHGWQARIDRMDAAAIRRSLQRGVKALTRILGMPPICSAVPGWKCNGRVLLEKNGFAFKYNSDCRGESIFRPFVNRIACTPQVPVTLPTYDEAIGTGGVTDANYNDHLLALLKPERLNVLTVHAEVEGMVGAGMFENFLGAAAARGADFLPLGDLLPEDGQMPAGTIGAGRVRGRQGWVCLQQSPGSAAGQQL